MPVWAAGGSVRGTQGPGPLAQWAESESALSHQPGVGGGGAHTGSGGALPALSGIMTVLPGMKTQAFHRNPAHLGAPVNPVGDRTVGGTGPGTAPDRLGRPARVAALHTQGQEGPHGTV